MDLNRLVMMMHGLVGLSGVLASIFLASCLAISVALRSG